LNTPNYQEKESIEPVERCQKDGQRREVALKLRTLDSDIETKRHRLLRESALMLNHLNTLESLVVLVVPNPQ